MSGPDRSGRLRVGLCLTALLAGFATLIGRTVQLQLRADERVSRRDRQKTPGREILLSQRGTIYDAQEKVLALNLKVPSVFADPKMIGNSAEFARKVGRVLRVSPREIFAKIRDRNSRFVWLKRQNDPAVEPRLAALGLEGLHIRHEGMRLYPDRQLAAQLIGFVGVDGAGLEGIEKFFDPYLRSRQLVLRSGHDRKGRPIFTEGTEVFEPEPGADLHLTIDSFIQNLVERELGQAAESSRAKKAMAVVMDPGDGRIYAMASYPPFNPNAVKGTGADLFRNRPVEEIFEPGSTFKVFTMASLLEYRAVDVSRRVSCETGSLRVNNKTIRTHVPHRWLTPAEVLKYSDNIGTSRLALALGAERLHDTVRKFGFGSDTGADLRGEVPGMLKPAERWRAVDLANISFGQGVGVTALQLAAALSVIANGGFKVRPHVVRKVRFPDGRELPMSPETPGIRILSSSTAETLTRWMEEVVAEGGTGTMAALDGWRTAGKTGTAQKVDPATRNYAWNKVVSSFMGFAPSRKPRLAAVFVFDEPAKADFGGTLAAPVYKRVMEGALSYLSVPRDVSSAPVLALKETPAPKTGVSLADAIRSAEAEGLLPDVRGMTVREVLSAATRLSMDVKITGSGVAVRQSPKPGRPLSGIRKLEVVFEAAPSRREET